MSNNYFDFRTGSLAPFVPGSKVRAGEVNILFDAVEAAFDLLPTTPESMELGKTTLGTESGSGNAYVVTMPNTRTSNANGDEVVFRATHTNTGAATLQVDAISAVALRRFNGDACEANDIVTGRFYAARYDSANSRFVIVWPAQVTTVSGGLVYAIPANSVSLAASAEGVATSVLRSDVQLTLSQAIAPTWTAIHKFTGGAGGGTGLPLGVERSGPGIYLKDTGAAANNGVWELGAGLSATEQFALRLVNDANNATANVFTVDRTANTVDLIAFTATAATFSGTLASTGALSGSTLTAGTVTSTGSLLVDTTVSVRDATNLFSSGTVPAARLPSSFSGLANPTGTIGLSAVNGVATTALRSDGAPALSQGIAPTWTELHTFSNATLGALLSSTTPRIDLIETDGAANNTRWGLSVASEQLQMFVRNDANSTGTNFMAVNRTANTIDAIDFTATAATFSGTLAVAGSVSVRDATNLFNTGTVPAARLPSSFSGLANPSASVGLSAVNGSATTALRSDGAPALSQSITPTWTGAHKFTGGAGGGTGVSLGVERSGPGIYFDDSGAAADNQVWEVGAGLSATEQFALRIVNDANSVASTVFSVDRTGTTVDAVAFPTDGTGSGTSGKFRVGSITSSPAGANTLAQFRTTSGQHALHLANVTSTTLKVHQEDTSGDNQFIVFVTEAPASATLRGSITYNRAGGLVAYNTTSDRRLKKNIRDCGDAGEVIDRIKVRAFDWIQGGTLDYWVVAQELHESYPVAVSVPTDEDTGHWAVDVTKLVPLMLREIQSLRARLASVEDKKK